MSYISGMAITQVDTDPKFTPGVVGQAFNGKKYKYVQYNSAVGVIAAVAGNVCYYYAPGGISTGVTVVVTSDVSDSANLGAGILQAVIPNLSYGWIQVTGPATITPALTSGGDGQPLVPSATDGTLKVAGLATDSVCAFAVDASAKIIMCRFVE